MELSARLHLTLFVFFICVALPCAPVCFRVYIPLPVLKAEAKALKRAREQATIQRKRDFKQLQRSKVGNADMSTPLHPPGKPLSTFVACLVAGGVLQRLTLGGWVVNLLPVARGVLTPSRMASPGGHGFYIYSLLLKTTIYGSQSPRA